MVNSSNIDHGKSIVQTEDRILYLCLRQDYREDHHQKVVAICRREKVYWEKIFITANRHGVAPLVFVNLNKFGSHDISVPGEITEKLRLNTISNIAIAGKRTAQLAKIYRLFNNLSIEIMAIKGAALEILVYDKPWYTLANDLDLIIKLDPSEFRQRDRWKLEDLKKDIPLEYDFMVHHDVTMNGILSVDFNSIWHDACRVQYKNHNIVVMSPEDMLITSCINSCRKRYLKLKALFDISEIINKLPNLNWTVFVRKAKEYRCNIIAYTALLATKETLGCPIPTNVFSELDVNPLRARIIQKLFRRISLYSLSDLSTKKQLFGRKVGVSLLLPYASYRREQVVGKLSYVWKTRESG